MNGKLDAVQYEREWQNLKANSPVDTHEYLTYHKQRFYELFDNLAVYLPQKPAPRVLEIGISVYTSLYKVFFPHIQLVTVDRPVELYGFDAEFAVEKCGAEYHYNIDLNRQAINSHFGKPPLGTFDYVIFSEVLEHLIINPVQLFDELLCLLAPDGLLYLTTPNFFSLLHLRQLANWDNPQAVFPLRGQDRDAGFHFREYSMRELIDFFEQAGGRVVKAHFSDCWDVDSDSAQLEQSPQFRADLMLVVCGASGDLPSVANDADWQFAKFDNAISHPIISESLHLDILQLEVAQLRRLVQKYEEGRLMRLMKWLHGRGLPHF